MLCPAFGIIICFLLDPFRCITTATVMRAAPVSTTQPSVTLREFAQQWANRDPNDVTSTLVKELLQHANDRELQTLFPKNEDGSFQRIGFGTAGLRSQMKAGPLGMNDLVVVQTAQGLVKHCENAAAVQHQQPPSKLCAVVGYDHRTNPALQLSSLSFALFTALVFLEAGWDCILLDGICATPLVPFAMLHFQQLYAKQQYPNNPVVGVMITASHNPKQDAGYKVYWNDGCQIRSPVDQQIAQSIQQQLAPWTDYKQLLQKRKEIHSQDPCLGLSSPEKTKQVVAAYYQTVLQSGLVTGQGQFVSANGDTWMQGASVSSETSTNWRPPKFCYTAMHGVGHRFAKQSFETFGLPPFCSVPSQQQPDPEFPTVSFPNPEEKGALDLAQMYAKENGCDIILANDPDADRLAVAEKCRTTGSWTVFTGDQIGSMLGLWLWQNLRVEEEKKPNPRALAMCSSTVSSKLLAEIARVEGFYMEETLTGFKWIGSKAAQLHREQGYRTFFCYEEAIGFCCGDVVFDKDGVSAMSVFAELTISVYRQGISLSNHLNGIYTRYGHFVSNNGYYFLTDPTVVSRIMDHITLGGKPQDRTSVGPYQIESIRYLGEPGYDSTTTDKKPTLPTSKSSPMMTIRFTNGCVAQFRASGTEPKFKYYLEMKGKPGVPRDDVQRDLMKMSGFILDDLLKPKENGLVKPGDCEQN